MYLLGGREVWPVYHTPWHIRCKYSCWDAPVVSRQFVHEDYISQVFQSSGMCCHVIGWAQASCVVKKHVACRIPSPSDAASHHRRLESEMLPPWKPQNSQIVCLMWYDTIVWQMDGTILVLPGPNYVGSHLDTYCFENIRYQLYMITLAPVNILVSGVGGQMWCVCVYCVYTNCSSTVDFAVLILIECTFLCDWCVVEVSSVVGLAVSSLWLTCR